jgi:hypothetical protein
MTNIIPIEDQPETQYFDPPSTAADDQDLTNFLLSLETIPVDSITFQKLANQSPARRYRATHRQYNPDRALFVPAPTGLRGFLASIHTTRRGRHPRVTYPHPSIHSYPRPVQALIRTGRKLDSVIQAVTPGPFTVPALASLLVLASFISAICAPAQAPSLKALDHPTTPLKQARDKEPRIKPKILFTTEQSFTLKLTDCRENDKQHVSCQFVDPTGKQRWLYIPGLTISHE